MKHTKLSVSGENFQKPPKIEVFGIFPPIIKKGKIKLHIYCLHKI